MVLELIMYSFNGFFFFVFACSTIAFLYVNMLYFMNKSSNINNNIRIAARKSRSKSRPSTSQINKKRVVSSTEVSAIRINQSAKASQPSENADKITNEKKQIHFVDSKLTPPPPGYQIERIVQKGKRRSEQHALFISKLQQRDEEYELEEQRNDLLNYSSLLSLPNCKSLSTPTATALANKTSSSFFSYQEHLNEDQKRFLSIFRENCLKELTEFVNNNENSHFVFLLKNINKNILFPLHECTKKNINLIQILYGSNKPCVGISFDNVTRKLYSSSVDTHFLMRSFSNQNTINNIEQIKLRKSILYLMQTFEGSNLMVGSYRNDRSLRLWDVSSKRMLDVIKCKLRAFNMCHVGKHLKFGIYFETGQIRIYEVASDRLKLIKQTQLKETKERNLISRMVYLNNARLAISRENSLYIWHFSTRRKPKKIFETERKTKLISNLARNHFLEQLFVCLLGEIRVFSYKNESTEYLFKLKLDSVCYIKEIKILNENLFVYAKLNELGFRVFDTRDPNKNKDTIYLSGMNKHNVLADLASREEVYCFDFDRCQNLVYAAYRNGFILSWKLNELF